MIKNKIALTILILLVPSSSARAESWFSSAGQWICSAVKKPLAFLQENKKTTVAIATAVAILIGYWWYKKGAQANRPSRTNKRPSDDNAPKRTPHSVNVDSAKFQSDTNALLREINATSGRGITAAAIAQFKTQIKAHIFEGQQQHPHLSELIEELQTAFNTLNERQDAMLRIGDQSATPTLDLLASLPQPARVVQAPAQSQNNTPPVVQNHTASDAPEIPAEQRQPEQE